MPKETISNDGIYNLEVGWSKWPTTNDACKVVSVRHNLDNKVEKNLIPHLLKDFTSELGGKMKDWARWNILTQEDVSTAGWGTVILHFIDEVVGDTYKGVGDGLNRDECNKLIKTIRKARDASFNVELEPFVNMEPDFDQTPIPRGGFKYTPPVDTKGGNITVTHLETPAANKTVHTGRAAMKQAIATLQAECERMYGKDQ